MTINGHNHDLRVYLLVLVPFFPWDLHAVPGITFLCHASFAFALN
jgi:hypothetical protein